MSKSLYSLMLSDEVVSQIDLLAMKNGLTRSGMVNAVLAEYASMLTPEKRIAQLCEFLQTRLGMCNALVPVAVSNRGTVCVKSALEYKYRPTIRYEVQLYRETGESIGVLNVLFRTTSAGLLELLNAFFRHFIYTEGEIYPDSRISYELSDGKFSRSIKINAQGDYNDNDVGGAISQYIEELDRLIKLYVNDSLTNEYLNGYKKRMSECRIKI